MTEREAFEALMRIEGRRTEQDADGVYSHVQGEWYVWQAACQWQREQDAKEAENTGNCSRQSIADAIRQGGAKPTEAVCVNCGKPWRPVPPAAKDIGTFFAWRCECGCATWTVRTLNKGD